MPSRTLLLPIAAFIALAVMPARPLDPGAYRVRYQLELPHVERWAIARTTTICVASDDIRAVAFPVLSGNNPLASCPRRDVTLDGAILRFEIACPGRGAARASAAYRLSADRFDARIAMVMGGKNMTMTEVQEGRRVGACEPGGVTQQ